MVDPYLRYGAAGDRASVARPSFPGFVPSEAPLLASHHILGSGDLQPSSEFQQKDINPLRSGAYGFGDTTGIGVHPEPGHAGLTAAASINGYHSPLEDPNMVSHRRNVALGVTPVIPDMISERPSSLTNLDGLPVQSADSNILFVDGLPTDCSRREVGHLFRPFIGFKEIRVVHKEPRRNGDRARVLCFVEFIDSKCALTAMEALQGYKFDDKKAESPTLRIQFAHFPFRLPYDNEEHRIGIPR